MESFGGRMDAVTEQIRVWRENGLKVVLASAQDRRLIEILGEFGIPASHSKRSARSSREYTSRTHPSARVLGYMTPGWWCRGLRDISASNGCTGRESRARGVPISSVLDLREGVTSWCM